MTANSIQADTIKIAYADDHAIVRKGIASYINSFKGCKVIIEADNGKQLISQLQAAAELPAICILDIFMPELDGPHTLQQLKENWPQIKTLTLTGQNTEYNLIQMIRTGTNGYLLKSSSPNQLEAAIRSIYETGLYISDALTPEYYQDIIDGKIKLPEFTDQEVEVLRQICTDLSYDQIADKLGVTIGSIEWTRNALFRKLSAKSRSGLVMYAIRLGMVEQSS